MCVSTHEVFCILTTFQFSVPLPQLSTIVEISIRELAVLCEQRFVLENSSF